MRAFAATSVVLILLAAADQADAQKKSAGLTKLGVDVVVLKDGPRLRGAILNRDKKGTITMAVSRTWLKEFHSELYEQRIKDEAVAQRQCYVELRDRIRDWLKQRADDKDLAFFLNSELERVEKILADKRDVKTPPELQFLFVEIPATRIRRYFVQPTARKQVVLVAWQERLSNPENKTVDELRRELQKRDIDPRKVQVELSDRLPLRAQNEREWAARKAVVEYQFRKRFDFQGTGDFVVRTGQAAKAPNLNQLVGQMLGGKLSQDLAKLLGAPTAAKAKTPTWFDVVTKSADRDGVPGVRVTRLDQNLLAKRVSVEVRFLARMPDGKWETIWKSTETSDASEPRPDLEKRIAKDPQVRQALDVIKALGIGAEQNIRLALRFGAATMEAQQNADARFFEFRDRYLRKLHGPPLVWRSMPTK